MEKNSSSTYHNEAYQASPPPPPTYTIPLLHTSHSLFVTITFPPSPVSSPSLARQEEGRHEAAHGDLRGHRGHAARGVHGGRRRRGDHHLAEEPAAAPAGVGVVVVRHVRRDVGERRFVPSVRLGELPVRPRRVRLPPVRPPRQAVPQVPVAAQPALLPAQVRRGGAASDVGRQEGDVRGGLAGAEPVRVAAVHAPRGGARRPVHRVAAHREDQPHHHRHLRRLQCDAGVLPVALPGGRREREGRPRPQARPDRRSPQLARRRRARLRLMALVAALRSLPAVGLHRGGRQVDEEHGPDAGLHQGAQHLGCMGGRQPRPVQHQSLLPGDLSLSLQGDRMGRVVEEELHGGDGAAQQHGAVPRRADPAAGGHQKRPRRHGQAGVPAGLHLPVAAEEGRTPDKVRRRHLRRRLHPLVHRRPPGHLERPLLRSAHRPSWLN